MIFQCMHLYPMSDFFLFHIYLYSFYSTTESILTIKRSCKNVRCIKYASSKYIVIFWGCGAVQKSVCHHGRRPTWSMRNKKHKIVPLILPLRFCSLISLIFFFECIFFNFRQCSEKLCSYMFGKNIATTSVVVIVMKIKILNFFLLL